MIKLTIVLNGRSKPLRQDGTAPIQIRAYKDRQKKLFPTGLYIKPQYWDGKSQQVINCDKAPDYNAEARQQLAELEGFILKRRHQNKTVTLDQLTLFLEKGKQNSFSKFMAAEMNGREDLAENTRKKDRTTLNHFKNFRKDVAFEAVNYELIHEFGKYLLKKGLSRNSANSHHTRLKCYINMAIKLDLFDTNPYKKHPLRWEPVDKFALTLHQLEQVEALEFTPNEWYLETKRDMFLICCYLGFRYSDMIKINRNDIAEDRQGLCYLLKAKKTKKTLMIPLYLLFAGKPEQLLKKYFKHTSVYQENLFYPYKVQTLNKDLKIIAQRAKIPQWERVTTKTGRSSFATYLAKKIPLHVLQALMQHSDIQTTLLYTSLSSRGIFEALEIVKW